jgi:hypothetical protein
VPKAESDFVALQPDEPEALPQAADVLPDATDSLPQVTAILPEQTDLDSAEIAPLSEVVEKPAAAGDSLVAADPADQDTPTLGKK